jgi:hypothetical protein
LQETEKVRGTIERLFTVLGADDVGPRVGLSALESALMTSYARWLHRLLTCPCDYCRQELADSRAFMRDTGHRIALLAEATQIDETTLRMVSDAMVTTFADGSEHVEVSTPVKG